MSAAASLLDTIVAPATAAGAAAIAIVRLAGPEARQLAAQLAPSARPRRSHRLYRCLLQDVDGAPLDDAMLVEMHAPHSYTGDDVVELHLHGAPALVQALLRSCCALGARPAEAGEFTLRAYLRGRLDLAQAEAVAALIGAQDLEASRAAMQQLRGGLRAALAPVLTQLQALLAGWRAALDFPDEVDAAPDAVLAAAVPLTQLAARLQQLAAQRQGQARARPQVVLWGPSNAGKSTLLNAWCGAERVLVDARPGTTRDPVSVEMVGPQGPWSLCDTAGLRPEADGLEARGQVLAARWAEAADLRLWLMNPETLAWPPPRAPTPLWVVGSQMDRFDAAAQAALEAAVQARGHTFAGWIAAPQHLGLPALRAAIEAQLGSRAGPTEAGLLVNARQQAGLEAAQAGLEAASTQLRAGWTLDVVTAEVEQASRQLGAVLGQDVDAAVLRQVFAQFCIGK